MKHHPVSCNNSWTSVGNILNFNAVALF